MEQKEKLTAWQHARRAVVCYLLFNAITASAIQHFAEMSPLLKIYNWLRELELYHKLCGPINKL